MRGYYCKQKGCQKWGNPKAAPYHNLSKKTRQNKKIKTNL